MSLQRRLRYLFLGLLVGLTATGCAVVEVRTKGEGLALHWHATDFRKYTVVIEGREIYEYTLVLEELNGTTITFTTLQAEFQNNLHSRRFGWEKAGSWVLPAHGEVRIPLGTYRYCGSDVCRDWGPLAPIWHLVLIGVDGRGRSVREAIEMRLPDVDETT